MKAILNGSVIADSSDIVSVGGYAYFPLASARMDWLEKSPRTAKDLECPHAVQFYDVIIDGERYPRNAWIYEAPQPRIAQVADRVGFWKDVTVG